MNRGLLKAVFVCGVVVLLVLFYILRTSTPQASATAQKSDNFLDFVACTFKGVFGDGCATPLREIPLREVDEVDTQGASKLPASSRSTSTVDEDIISSVEQDTVREISTKKLIPVTENNRAASSIASPATVIHNTYPTTVVYKTLPAQAPSGIKVVESRIPKVVDSEFLNKQVDAIYDSLSDSQTSSLDELRETFTTAKLTLTGALHDVADSSGQNGYVLQSTGAGVRWVATSTLGFGGASSLLATDIDSSSEFAAILGDETGTGNVVFSNAPSFSGNVGIGTTTASEALTLVGDFLLTGTITTPLIDGCVEVAAGVLTSTGSNCGTGGGGITSLNGQSNSSQSFASSSAGTDFRITSAGGVHTFQLPSASASARGLLTAANWTTFNNKVSSTSIDTSAELAAILSDETGTGNVVFSASPTFTGTINAAAATLSSTLTLSGSAANIALGSNYLSGDGDDEGIFVSSTGLIGIGTSSPTHPIHVYGANSTIKVQNDTVLSQLLSQVLSDGTSRVVFNDVNTSGRRFDIGSGVQVAGSGAFGIKDNLGGVRFVIDSLGYIGMGTSSPSRELHVFSNKNAGTKISASNPNSGNAAFSQISADALGGSLYLYALGTGYTTSGRFKAGGGILESTGVGGLGVSTVQDNIYFYTNSGVERMRITSTGLVGIGSTTPDSALHVRGTNSQAGGITIESSAGTDADRLAIFGSGNFTSVIKKLGNSGPGNWLEFQNSAGATEMTLDNLGRLGIGTSSPSQELTVAGDLRLTGRIYDSSNSAGTNGMVLRSTGTGQTWVATSTLGFGASFSNSAGLAALLSDETGTGFSVFSASPTFTGTLNAAAATLSSTLTMSGSAANIALGSNYLSGDGGDEGIHVSSTGLVSIGTSTAAAELYITSTNPSFIVDDTDALGSQIEFVASGANTYIRSGVSSSDTNAVFRVVRTGTTNVNVKNFDVYATTTYLTGSLGIGTTSPLSKLHVHSPTGDSIVTLTGSDSANRGVNFNLQVGTPAWSLLMDANEDLVIREHRSGADNFRIQNTAGTDLLFLETATGKFALGTSTTNAVLRIDDTANTTGALFVSSSNATPGAGANLATFQTTNATWDRPLVRVIDSSTSGAAANIRIDSPNPDIEFVESDQVAPSGKFEIAGSGNRFQINSRRTDETAFENIMEFAQRAQTSVDAVTINIDSTSATRNALKIINNTSSSGAQPGIAWRNASSTVDTARISSLAGASGIASKLLFEVADSSKVLQTRMVVDVAGNVGIGTTTPSRTLTVAGSARITGALYGANNTAGTNGQVLQSTGSGFNWVATSTLGFASTADFNTSAELAAILGDETGTGEVVFATSPTFTTQITTPALRAAANDSGSLGVLGTAFSDLFLASGGVIDWNANDVVISATTNALNFEGATNGYQFHDGPIRPIVNDGISLGVSGTAFSDLFLASGGVINWSTGDVRLNHSADSLSLTGGTFSLASSTQSARLTLSGSAANIALGNNFLSGDGDDEGVFVSSAGNVGIGTSTPIATLNLETTGSTVFQAKNSSTTFAAVANIYNSTNAGLRTLVYGPSYVGGSIFSVGANGTALAQTASGPFGIGTFGVAQPLIFGTDSTEKMRITSAGNVGVGTTTPSERLDVAGSIRFGYQNEGSTPNAFISGRLGRYIAGPAPFGEYSFIQPGLNDAFAIWNSDSAIVAAFGQDGSGSNTNSYFAGNVGIGTTTPPNKLTVAGSANFTGTLTVQNTNPLIAINNTSTGAPSSIQFSNSGTLKSLIGVTSAAAQHINTLGAGDLAIRTQSQNIGFSVNSGTSEALRITSAGNVGIGTTTPAQALSVIGNIRSSGGLFLGGGSSLIESAFTNGVHIKSVDGGVIELHANSNALLADADLSGLNWYAGTAANNIARVGARNVTTSENTGSLYFSTAQTGTLTERMVITNGGKVGINIPVPQTTLDISATTGSTIVSIGDVGADAAVDFGDTFLVGTNPGDNGNFKISGNASFGNGGAGGNDIFMINSSTFNPSFGYSLFMEGSTANIALGDNYLSGDGGDEGIFVSSTGLVGIGTSTPSVSLTIDSGSNSGALRIAGLAEATELADMYVAANGAFVIDTKAGAENGFIDLRSEDTNFGLVLRDSTGSTTAYTNFFHNAGPIDYLNIVVQGSNTTKGLIVDANDRVGIGTTTLTEKFTVAGTGSFTGNLTLSGTAANIVLGSNYLSGDGQDEGIFIDSTAGRVLIGSNTSISQATPGSVTGGTIAPQLQINDTSVAGSTLSLTRWAAGVNTGGLLLSHSRGAAVGTFAAVVSGDDLGSVTFAGDDGTDIGTQAAIIRAEVDGTVTTNRIPGRLVFSTALGTTDDSIAEKMRLTAAGFLGIGDTSPDDLLNVHSASAAAQIAITSLGTDTDTTLGFQLADGTNTFTMGVDDSDGDKFKISGSALGTNDRLTIDSVGNVGIGTTTPAEELTVAGTIQSTVLLGGATSLSTDAQGNIIRTPSDERLKTDIATIEGALEKVLALRGVTYGWRDTERFGDQLEIGFLAQEVDLILPEAVRKGGEYWSLNTSNIVAVVVEAVKELAQKFDDITQKLTTKEVQTDKLCVGSVCVTQSELAELLEQTTPTQETSGGDEGVYGDSDSDQDTVVPEESGGSDTDEQDGAGEITGGVPPAESGDTPSSEAGVDVSGE